MGFHMVPKWTLIWLSDDFDADRFTHIDVTIRADVVNHIPGKLIQDTPPTFQVIGLILVNKTNSSMLNNWLVCVFLPK